MKHHLEILDDINRQQAQISHKVNVELFKDKNVRNSISRDIQAQSVILKTIDSIENGGILSIS